MKIKAPCPFQPSASNQVEGGFNCTKCQRIVHDMRDQENIDWKEWERGERCGIFRADQMETVYFSNWKKVYFQCLIVLAFLGWNVGPISAQTTNESQMNKTEKSAVNKNRTESVSTMPKKIHWWQFVQRRKLRKKHVIGCPSF
jgi:hypothetical protein